MSNVRFKCPHCGQLSEGAAEYIGIETPCPSCGKTFRLEAAGEAPAPRRNGLQCYFGIFKNYVKFSGRARRREYWYALLFNLVGTFIAGFIDGVVLDEGDNLFVYIYSLATFTPMLALQFRRLHDTGKSGWWWPIVFLPVVNLAYLVWLTDDGDKGRNRFGPNHKGR